MGFSPKPVGSAAIPFSCIFRLVAQRRPVTLHSIRKNEQGLAIEDSEHILLKCPKFNSERQQLTSTFSSLGLELNLINLRGLNSNLPSQVQFRIAKSFHRFINQAKLPEII